MLKNLGGKIEVIQDIECNIPPVGYVWNVYTDKLEKVGVAERAPRKKDQYWERPLPPSDWDQRREVELKSGIVDTVCEKYRRQEWFRRLNGFWFMNNGNPTYLTGLHYFFLTHWFLGDEVDYGNFRDRDRKFFYFLQYVIEDPRCVGLIYVTRRREGKTSKGCAFLYEYVSRTKKAFAGIQSKTDFDAEQIVFQRGIINPFTHLPDFFRPIFDTSSGKRPKKKLTFITAAKKGKAALGSFGEDELNSEIDFKASTVGAYDGSKLARYYCDEVFKTPNLNINERHRIVKPCCTDDRGQFTGKMFYSSTVEEIQGSIKDYRLFWDQSDQTKRNANGRTITGLYRYFLPANEALNYDIYGFEDTQKNLEFFLAEREALRNDPIAYASEIRKNPLNIEEAFRQSGNTAIFDTEKINDQLSVVATFESELIWEGDLVWTNGAPEPNGPDTSVVFKERKGGKFRLLRNQKMFLPNEEKFAFLKRNTYFAPTNVGRFTVGLDTFDHISTVDSRRSNGAAYLYYKFNSMEPDTSGLPIMEYIYREAHPRLFYDDVIKMAAFSGANILFEDNKPGFLHYCDERGFRPLLVHLPDRQQPGIPASTKTKLDLAETLKTYVLDSCHKIYFTRLLQDLLDFDIMNTKAFDAVMGFGWTLVSDKSLIFAKNTSPNTTEGRLDISKIFR